MTPDGGPWTSERLVDVLDETLALARMRCVTLQQVPLAGLYLPALYFRDVRFVLSHTGWPWVDEALAMATKFSNVYLGTATWPPARWGQALLDFARGPGRRKLLFGTGFPVVGHAQGAAQLAKLGLEPAALQQLVADNARSVFTRLA